MKKMIALALVSLLATTAFALVDEDQDMMGLYFDTAGDVVCANAPFLYHLPMYVLYTNPSIAAVRGFECGITMGGAVNTTMSISSMPTGYTNVGSSNGSSINLIVGYASPVPTSNATVLATLDIFHLDFVPLDFYIGESVPSSNTHDLPMVMLDDFSLLLVGTSADGGPAAQVNAFECFVVDSEDFSFGAVKALYR